MLKSFLNAIQKKRRRGEVQDQHPSIPRHLLSSEREDDGFVLVGATKSERSTVLTAGQPVTHQYQSYPDSPPSYEDCFAGGVQSMGQQPSNLSTPITGQSQDTYPKQVIESDQSQPGLQSVESKQVSDRSMECLSSDMQTLSVPSVQSFQTDNVGTLTSISDVPFKLSPEMQVVMGNSVAGVPSCRPSISPINWNRYTYNFSFERMIVEQTK